MAELYGRVLGFPDRRHIAGIIAILAAICFSLPAEAGAEGPDEERLLELARALQSDDAAGRAAAIEELSHLPASSLPAIEARIVEMRRLVVPTEDGLEAVRRFRHATGSRRADDMNDIAPGVPAVLTERRSRTSARMAERLLLMRSLEAMGRTDAFGVMMDILGIDFEPWRWEAPRIEARHGINLLPALIEATVHDSAGVRRWANRAIERLGMGTPGDAIQQDDPRIQADLMRAWAKARNFDAMEVIISFVGHDDAQLRDAARASLEQFGRNSIWQLRIAMRNQLGREADHSWGWRRTMDLLYEGLDARRTEAIEGELEAGLSALAANDLSSMQTHFEEVLREEPTLQRRVEMGRGYAALASDLLEGGDEVSARDALIKALRLSPDDPEARRWQWELAFVDAERRRESGVADAAAYREVLSLDPAHEAAAERLEELTGEVAPGHESRSERRGHEALMLALLGFLLLLPRGAWRPLRLGARFIASLVAKHVEMPELPADSLKVFKARMELVRSRFASSDELEANAHAVDEIGVEASREEARAEVLDADDPELDIAALFFDETPSAPDERNDAGESYMPPVLEADDTLPEGFVMPEETRLSTDRYDHIVDSEEDVVDTEEDVVDTEGDFDLDSLFPDAMQSSPGTISSPGLIASPDDTLPG